VIKLTFTDCSTRVCQW